MNLATRAMDREHEVHALSDSMLIQKIVPIARQYVRRPPLRAVERHDRVDIIECRQAKLVQGIESRRRIRHWNPFHSAPHRHQRQANCTPYF